MSDQEVMERLAYLQELEEAINAEQTKARDRLGIKPRRAIPEQCEACGSTNLEPKVKDGGYLCRKCGFRKIGMAPIIDADAAQRGIHQCRP